MMGPAVLLQLSLRLQGEPRTFGAPGLTALAVKQREVGASS
jgi:hypothetical protein